MSTACSALWAICVEPSFILVMRASGSVALLCVVKTRFHAESITYLPWLLTLRPSLSARLLTFEADELTFGTNHNKSFDYELEAIFRERQSSTAVINGRDEIRRCEIRMTGD